MICPEFRVTGTDLLDSFNFNPHKVRSHIWKLRADLCLTPVSVALGQL
jgi:hypothetical protein